ncbi:CbtA family protein [Methylobacterium nonmethylotrophicum]|uniref:Cobalt transporter n=1 Tax=Methylobacterium nonmethylotrophicum TaxID=1141884 RepID=A0A4Z0NX85_9HYPH|nr:CbtA family protein [Methylobacterium nonmethylotrophicum]TGE01934.1 cobalt transporter [Methylobacterium nonmethylotrophicum]
MTKRLLAAALVAGFLAACVASALQFALTSPLILAAEKYETAAAPAPVHAFANPLIVLAHAGHDHGADEAQWQPAPGLPRLAFTALATLVSGVGYALLLGAVLVAAGRTVTPSEALTFGIGGFLSASLAPAIGLPPELPGMAAAALEARQLWWVATALATAAGLYLVAIRRGPAAVALGLALIVAPHVWGAPHGPEEISAMPPVFAAQFTARSLAIAFAFWAVLGLAFGWAWGAVEGRQGVARQTGVTA